MEAGPLLCITLPHPCLFQPAFLSFPFSMHVTETCIHVFTNPMSYKNTIIRVHVCIDFNGISCPLISTAVQSNCVTCYTCTLLRCIFSCSFLRLKCMTTVILYQDVNATEVHWWSLSNMVLTGLQLLLSGCFNGAACEARGFTPPRLMER